MKHIKLHKYFTIFMLLAAATLFAQQPKVETSIDSTRIKIGSQFNLTLKTTVDIAAKVNFPEGKNFGQLEVLESYPVDTVRKGAMYELVKKYGLTQFDSGRYVVPQLPVFINNTNIKTDSLTIEVTPVAVDTLQQKMYDIKDVATASGSNSFWIWLLAGIVVAAAIAFGVWWFIKKRKKPEVKEEEVHYTSPIEKATTQLKALESKSLLQKGAVKDYYSELTDIARTYIEEAIHIPAMESTTGELIDAMRNAVRRKNMKLTQETFEELEKVLRNADMVKFAKVRPVDFEIAEDRSRIEKTIVKIDQSIPEEKEEDEEHTLSWLEAQRKKEAIQKRKKKRIIIIVAAALVLLTGLFFVGRAIALKAYGESSEQLLAGEWIKSAYGSPPIVIETPKVLIRQDVEKLYPENAMAIYKEMQVFSYGTLGGHFSVSVSTMRYKQEIDPDLARTAEGYIQVMEAAGSRDIIVKTEEFATPGGLQGLRAYGNMATPHPVTKQMQRMYYELLFFKQENGLQIVSIMYREGDEYGAQVLDRVKNSIEIYKLN
ncbi:hypothetical protein [Flavobacterium sp.]|uniref:hypothetical protein n=1 Tax=Flavobacterium sp. TaxID=239 RepID=UPI002638FE5F|nr:hypothetical protein [Flavobacterium sp.]